ncbi:MAG: enoyl-CoA hydratase/isomerase family protein [Acidobacteria bacterium]|nr:enoyl-CoA hydratase/isomerase family protein [Acidobacteriota bacterium]
MSNPLTTEAHGDALVVRFTRPDVRNPLSADVIAALNDVIESLSRETERLILTGSEGVFASGADLREVSKLDAAAARGFAELGQSLMNRISNLPVITIAAVNGPCFGGALDLALACKRRIATSAATFCHPGARLGIITGWGGTQRLPRLIGEARALEMFFTAEPFPAEWALNAGLVDRVTENPVMAVIEEAF